MMCFNVSGDCRSDGSLRGEDLREFTWRGSQQPLDIAQRNANELQRDNLLEDRHIPRHIDSILRRRAPRLEQAKPVVVVKRTNTHASQRGELVDAVGRLIGVHRV
jgi:hypothetical protein